MYVGTVLLPKDNVRRQLDPQPQSGRQELFEGLIANQF
jgi:hypothetical protein